MALLKRTAHAFLLQVQLQVFLMIPILRIVVVVGRTLHSLSSLIFLNAHILTKN